MPMILRGITHVIIETAHTKEDVAKKGVYAVASLCFGPGDTDCISQLEYVQASNKRMVWRMPAVSRERDGKPVNLLVFNGGLIDELSQWAIRAMARIKTDLGKVSLAHIYRVTANEAKDVTGEVVA